MLFIPDSDMLFPCRNSQSFFLQSGGGSTFYYTNHVIKRFIPHVHRALPLIGFENGSNLAENRIPFADILKWKFHLFLSEPGSAKGWEQTNFVELLSVSRPRLAEMAIEIWVMRQLTEKLFETSSVRWNLQVRIFVQILRDTSMSEHLREWKRKETCME